MPPKKKTDELPSTMKELKETLWKAADKLRGSMDASQYKDVILGLVFLKYVSDAFDERRLRIHDELKADGWDEAKIAGQLDDVDEYTGRGVFWVPKPARWTYLAEHAKGLPPSMGTPIGELVDEAMDLVMGSNPSLAGTLPRIFNRDNVDQRRLGELLDLFNSARFTGQGAAKARDLLGEVYEYFLEKFAKAEGKRGGEFYTPAGAGPSAAAHFSLGAIEPRRAAGPRASRDGAAGECLQTARARRDARFGSRRSRRHADQARDASDKKMPRQSRRTAGSKDPSFGTCATEIKSSRSMAVDSAGRDVRHEKGRASSSSRRFS